MKPVVWPRDCNSGPAVKPVVRPLEGGPAAPLAQV